VDYAWKLIEPERIKGTNLENFALKNAPPILYTKNDKEIFSTNYLIYFFFIIGFYLVFLSVWTFLGFNMGGFEFFSFTIITIIVITTAVPLLILYIRGNVYNKPIQSYYELYEVLSETNENVYLCLVFYPCYSGKSHPDEVFNRVYKIYQESVLSNTIDITQIEVYFKNNTMNLENLQAVERIGYFFKYGERQQFYDENTNRDVWRFFKADKSSGDNFISVANWDHLYEWKEDLVLDYDKLHQLAPWIITRWDNLSLIPLTRAIKEELKFDKRYIHQLPKLKPWVGDVSIQEYKSELEHYDLENVQRAIDAILIDNISDKNLKLIKKNAKKFKSYFIENRMVD